MKDPITFADFLKLDIKIGKVISAQKVENADKLLKIIFDFGDFKRQIMAGIAEFFQPEELVGKSMPVLINLEAKNFRGHQSQGMIIAADVDGRPILLQPDEEIPAGSIVR